MTAVKSGNHIYISGTGNTLASITTDINDTNFIEKTSNSPDIYTVKGTATRYFRIRNGGTLTIGDSTDYSKNETLTFNSSTANNLRFYVDTGGTLLMYGDTKIDFMTGTQRSYYSYIYGKVDVLGNATYKPVWQNYQRIYLYEQQNNNNYSNDVWHFENMIFGSACTVNYYCIYINGIGKTRNHIFKDIIFDKTYGRGLAMYCMRLPYDIRGLKNVTFENINFENVGNYPLYVQGARPHFKGTDFGTTTSWKVLVYGTTTANGDNTHFDFDYHGEHDDGQHFVYLEDCTFRNENNKNCLVVQYGGVVLCKDCTWEHNASDSIQCAYGGVVMLWTGNTFTSREYYDVDFDGRIQRVFGLTLTIKDKHGNNLEDALVIIEQSEGKETRTFHTGSDGKLLNDHDLGLALLTNIHQYYNSKTTNIEYWSDDSNSTYHKVTVFKEGYIPVSQTYVMDEDRTDTIYLREVNNHKMEI